MTVNENRMWWIEGVSWGLELNSDVLRRSVDLLFFGMNAFGVMKGSGPSWIAFPSGHTTVRR